MTADRRESGVVVGDGDLNWGGVTALFCCVDWSRARNWISQRIE